LFGFGTLSVTLGALQIMLDRGEQQDWFNSGENHYRDGRRGFRILPFIVHIFTSKIRSSNHRCSATVILRPECCSS